MTQTSVQQKSPPGWKETTLGEVAEINPRESLSKGTVAKYVAMENLNPFTRKIYEFKKRKFNGGSKFRNGDTLLARITPCLENGKTAYVDLLDNEEIGFGSTEYIVLREKQGLSDKQFLYYFAISPRFRNAAIQSMTGTSGRQRVQTDLISNRRFSIPPLSEQKAIAAVLSSFDDKIELLREQNKTLEATAQTIFKEWFINFESPVALCHSRESGNPDWIPNQVGDDRKGYKSSGGKMIESELGPIPEGWKVGRLTDIADFLNGLALQKYPPETRTDFLPVIKIREMKSGITELTDKASKNLEEKYIVNNGDILFSWSGSLEIEIWKYGKGALNQHLFKVTSEKYPKWFYYYWIKYHLPNFKQIASAKAVTMGHIKRHHLDDAFVVIAYSDFINEADRLLFPLFEKTIGNDAQIQTLSKIRDTLLPKLMTGKLRVGGF